MARTMTRGYMVERLTGRRYGYSFRTIVEMEVELIRRRWMSVQRPRREQCGSPHVDKFGRNGIRFSKERRQQQQHSNNQEGLVGT